MSRVESLRLLQVTDCHLGANPGELLLGLNPDESLADVLALLALTESSADCLVATGDISSQGELESYHRFLHSLQGNLSMPMGWLAGNHDVAVDMKAIRQPSLFIDYMDLGLWQIILLDSSVPGEIYGNISEDELQRLEGLLNVSDKHTLVFVHHQPVPVGSAWMDQYIIRNATRLLDLLAQHQHVKGLIWGHVHQDFTATREHIKLYGTPSTCIQFKANSDGFALDTSMPGYRWFDLHADGRFDTGVKRVSEKDYSIDFSSEGY